MNKRKVLRLIFILGIVMPLFSGGKLQEDMYVGKTIDRIMLLLGEPSSDKF